MKKDNYPQYSGCYNMSSNYENSDNIDKKLNNPSEDFLEEIEIELSDLQAKGKKLPIRDAKLGLDRFYDEEGNNGFSQHAIDPFAGLNDDTSDTSIPTLQDITNPKDRLGSKKVNLSLVPPVANIYEAKVMELGAEKYSAYNWRETPVRLSVYTSAILRHLYALMDGQDTDEESGQPHIAHIRANTGILLDAKESGKLIDDRGFGGHAPFVIKKVEKK